MSSPIKRFNCIKILSFIHQNISILNKSFSSKKLIDNRYFVIVGNQFSEHYGSPERNFVYVLKYYIFLIKIVENNVYWSNGEKRQYYDKTMDICYKTKWILIFLFNWKWIKILIWHLIIRWILIQDFYCVILNLYNYYSPLN